MNWKQAVVVVVVGLVVLVGVFIGGLSLYTDQLYRNSYSSGYTYYASFGANQSLEDVTIYLPVPVEGTKVRIDETNLTVHGGDETTPADAPPVNASIVQTEHGPMLAITTDSFTVEPHYYRFVEENGEVRRVEIDESEYDSTTSETAAFTERSVRIELGIEADHSINTLNPTGTEPLLSPEFERRTAPCEATRFDTLQCYDVQSRTYLSYDALPETRASIWVEFEGRNEWWVFGWNGNYYTERFVTEFRGPQDGWQNTTGRLETGWGNYRGDLPASVNTSAS